jgi:hypothetical protein
MKTKKPKLVKTLGRIAYDSSPNDGGKSNFGPWREAPQVVRDIHERMAAAVEKHVMLREAEKWRPACERIRRLARLMGVDDMGPISQCADNIISTYINGCYPPAPEAVLQPAKPKSLSARFWAWWSGPDAKH